MMDVRPDDKLPFPGFGTDPQSVRRRVEAIDTTAIRDFDTAFLRKEWEDVVLAGGIEDRDAYLKVPRLGRGI